jgi:hypothetical protein
VFWPYAYTDMFYYAFWPAAYDDGYWAYAYDDFLDGTYWAYGNPYAAYAYAGPNPETAGLAAGPQRGRAADGRGQIAATCEQTANIANWPFGQIEAAIAPTSQQQALLCWRTSNARPTAQAACSNRPVRPRTHSRLLGVCRP